ncbi:chromosomal replication initiator protein DnaA [Quisquiliibacterium transsilvanicum]|uniref:chromosomal replication initiator protein DnaA n=1 Tax=Quisquiliibacterium transsilvanicum TaxID=1549638 RepID=UPI0016098438
MQDHWLACAARLEAEVPAQLFKTWIKPLVCLGYEPEEQLLRLGAPNQFKLNWVRTQFGSRIAELAAGLLGPQTRVAFELAPGQPSRSAAPTPRAPQPTAAETRFAGPEAAGAAPGQGADAAAAQAPEQPPAPAQPVVDRSRLRAELTFENFVTGKSNQMARATALQVVDRPGSYNPLFLYGGVGLGKTHLIHAVGNAFVERNPRAKVRYIHAQEYFDEMVRAIQRKTSEDLKHYYQSLDLLLIDDIQFLSGKPRTQEEFFYTFDALYAARKQIIITCDTYPKEISGIEERLISRFDSGLIVAIEPPELEMRVAILLKKAEQQSAQLPEDVAFFIAKHLRSNVRELEGALLRVIAYAGFRNKPVTLDLAKEALEDLLALNRRQISVEVIQKTVADFFKIKVAEMYGKRRHAHIVLPRQIAMYLAKELTQKSLPEIGEGFGGRDHTTVLHAMRKITEQRQHDPELNHQIHVLEQTLRG